ALKRGELRCLVATSSLELGIDMGAIDLVVQGESPKSVARSLQRVGRAGHQVGVASAGRIFPKFRVDLLECAVVTRRMRGGALAVANAGTIPDRGQFGVFLADGSGRVGELDEEMVYEARVGQVFLLGASGWRIERITRDRVLVSPAPGQVGQIPFWKGEGPGR